MNWLRIVADTFEEACFSLQRVTPLSASIVRTWHGSKAGNRRRAGGVSPLLTQVQVRQGEQGADAPRSPIAPCYPPSTRFEPCPRTSPYVSPTPLPLMDCGLKPRLVHRKGLRTRGSEEKIRNDNGIDASSRIGGESDRLRHAAPHHDPDASRGLDQRRRSGQI